MKRKKKFTQVKKIKNSIDKSNNKNEIIAKYQYSSNLR